MRICLIPVTIYPWGVQVPGAIMGAVVEFPRRRHARASARKSSAETLPFVILLRQLASCQDGRDLPRRMRLMVLRSQDRPAPRTSAATSSSSSSRSDMKADSCMGANVHEVHIAVKPPCAWNPVGSRGDPVHDMHMAVSAKKTAPGRSAVEPARAPSFMQAWRTAARPKITQEAMAEKLGYSDHTTISKIENGHVPYNQEILEGYARVLKCTVVDLLTRSPGDAEHILGIWARLSPKDRKRLENWAKDDED